MIDSTIFESTKPSRLFELCLAVVTVDWITIESQPASTATGAKRLVEAGTNDAKHLELLSFIFLIIENEFC